MEFDTELLVQQSTKSKQDEVIDRCEQALGEGGREEIAECLKLACALLKSAKGEVYCLHNISHDATTEEAREVFEQRSRLDNDPILEDAWNKFDQLYVLYDNLSHALSNG